MTHSPVQRRLAAYQSAKAYLERGFCQGASAVSETGHVKMGDLSDARSFSFDGAMNQGIRDAGANRDGVYAHMNEVLGKFDWIAWNDAPGRTQEEALDLVQRLINSMADIPVWA